MKAGVLSTPPRVWNVICSSALSDYAGLRTVHPAQVYHMLLRRQALRGMRRPLVVMSPKSCCVTHWRCPAG